MASNTRDRSSRNYQNTSDLTQEAFSKSSLIEKGWTILSGLCLAILLTPLVAVLAYVIIRGVARLDWQAFTELPPAPLVGEGGFANALVGSLLMLAIASAISIPFGVLAGIYLSEFSSGRIAKWIRFFTNVLSGVPSIIIGIFAYGILVLTTGTFSALAGGVALSILMLPIVTRTADEALQIVPKDVRWASVGMGASDFQTVLRVVIPAALPGLITGITLAVARGSGEAAPLLFTALFNYYWIDSLFEPTASLSVMVFNFATGPYENQQELAWAGSFVMVLVVLLTSMISRYASSKSIY